MRTSIRLKAKYGVVVFVSCLMGLGTLASAKDDAKLVFSVIGDIPYSKKEVKILKRHVEEHNLYSPSEFFCARWGYARYQLQVQSPGIRRGLGNLKRLKSTNLRDPATMFMPINRTPFFTNAKFSGRTLCRAVFGAPQKFFSKL